MRLADQLREQGVEKYRHCYLRYEALLAQLQAEGGGPPALPAPGGAPPLLAALQAGAACTGDAQLQATGAAGGSGFQRAFLQEAQRLRLFVKSSLEQLWLALLEECASLHGLGEELLQAGAGRSQHVAARLAGLRACLDATAAELTDLERFLRHNVAASAQLAQMHDQQLLRWQPAAPAARGGGGGGGGEEALPVEGVEGSYLAAAHGALLGGLALEPLVVGLSDGYELCRALESDAAALAGQPATWVPPDRFQRVTRKFWLHPADVMRFKCEVAKHLPVLLFGDRRKLTEGSPHEVRFLRDHASLSDSGEVTSVYYDNPAALPSYHIRLRKDDGASVVRLRWYGERSLSGGQRIFVERKVHRDRYTGELSYKERAPIAQRDVAAYTSGMGAPPEQLQAGGPHAEFLADAQRFLVQGGQEPLVRTVYRRTAFQEASNNLVRISLDSQLHVVLEAGAPRAPGDWDMSVPLGPADAVYFPYCVVEIKLQAEPPAWVAGLLQTGMLLPVPKFSKFLHGTALLLQPRCRNVPYWFLPDERDPRRMSPATWEEMADPADEYLQKGVDWLFPRDRGLPADPSSPAAALAAEGPAQEAAPFRPAPLRFLRRNRTAPAPSGSRTSSSDGVPAAVPAAGGALAAAPGAAAGAWEDLQVAGGAPSPQRQAALPSAGLQAGGFAAAAPAAAAVVAPPGGASLAAVHRSCTWPVYNNPLAFMPPPSEPSAASLLPPPLPHAPLTVAAAAAGGPCGGAAPAGDGGCAGPEQGLPRTCSSPAQSQASALHDSAQDLEAGQLQPAAKPAANGSSGGLKPPGGASGDKSGGDKGGGAGGAAPGASSAPAFAALQFRMPGPPPGGNGAGLAPGEPKGRVKALVRTRVEPKTFFANERTFLQWVQISVLIMMTATSLLSGSGLLSSSVSGHGGSGSCNTADKGCLASKLSGAIIAPVALLFMAYALFMFKKRTWQILRRETVRYDDQRGPVVLVIILLAVFILSYVLALVWIF